MPDTAPLTLSPLVDRFDRVHRDLRISLTDRCSLRCTYCMPAQGVPWLAKTTMLTTEELIRLASVAVSLGITEVRLTGGEPLLRRDLVDVVGGMAAMEGAEGPVEVSMTTNALGLDKAAVALKEAGLTRVNISLDTLQTETFKQMARRDRLDDTLTGIRAAADAGLTPLKLNTVLLRGVNDHEAVDLLAFALRYGY
ncbi:MAG: radical SAM protein, partial [Ornithinimicrobium sp.]